MSAYVIAEAGTGHKGVPTMAVRLATIAKCAGSDAVKFQMFVPDEPLFCPLEGDEKRIPRWNETAISLDSWKWVKDQCDDIGIDFLASVFQPTGIEWLKELQPKYYKVASRAAKTYPYEDVPGPFLISNGMGLPDRLPRKSLVLHCVSEYPTPLNKARWRSRAGRARTTPHYYKRVGLSDHSGTPWPAIDAIARGAKFIEVHFGDKEGPDGPVNLTTDELKLICEFRDAVTEMRNS